MRPNEHFYCECLKEPLAVLNLHTDKSYKAWNRLVLYHPCFHLPAGIWICFPWRNFRQFTHLSMRAKYSFLFSNLHTDRQQRALHSPEHLRETEREKVKKVPGREKEKNHPNNKLGKKKQLEWVKREFSRDPAEWSFCGTWMLRYRAETSGRVVCCAPSVLFLRHHQHCRPSHSRTKSRGSQKPDIPSSGKLQGFKLWFRCES